MQTSPFATTLSTAGVANGIWLFVRLAAANMLPFLNNDRI
jgi:hypothetical protein